MTNIVVAFPKIDDATNIKNLLVRNGYQVTAVCTSGAKVLSAISEYNDGIVICGYKLTDMMYCDVYESMPEQFQMILLASQARISEAEGSGVVSVVMPLKVNDLRNTIDMICEGIERRRRKRKLIPKKRNEEEQKTIDTAKKILMEKNNLTEYEAHRYIQKTSMDSATNMVETAEMIIRIMMN